jgi:hypothetical protein
MAHQLHRAHVRRGAYGGAASGRGTPVDANVGTVAVQQPVRNSISEPDNQFVKDQWKFKQACALDPKARRNPKFPVQLFGISPCIPPLYPL